MTAQDIQKAAETMSVGVQKNVCVTSGLREFASYGMFKATPVKGTDQRITQVFTAALDPYANDSATPGFENLARIALHGAYKGTFDVVRELQAKKLYLTLVGGGVFQNKFEWIAEAIDAAFHEFCFRELVGFFGRHEMKPSYEKTEVTLVLYYISPDQKATADWQKAKQILKQLVAKSKGTWTRYTSVGVEKVVEN